jgi:hypothetical protein
MSLQSYSDPGQGGRMAALTPDECPIRLWIKVSAASQKNTDQPA